ncbi:hypothetical protein ABT185_32820 [Streptomyces clavifer]
MAAVGGFLGCSRAVDSLWAGGLDGFTSIFAPDALYEIPFTPAAR